MTKIALKIDFLINKEYIDKNPFSKAFFPKAYSRDKNNKWKIYAKIKFNSKAL